MPARKVTSGAAERITVTLDADDHTQLKHMADMEQRSVAWFVRMAVSEYLDKEGKKEDQCNAG